MVDMPLNSIPPTSTVGGLQAKQAVAAGRCHASDHSPCPPAEKRLEDGEFLGGMTDVWQLPDLAAESVVDRVEVATTHFKGDYPESCTVEACLAPAAGRHEPRRGAGSSPLPEAGWWTVVERSRLGPHARHVFPVAGDRPATP